MRRALLVEAMSFSSRHRTHIYWMWSASLETFKEIHVTQQCFRGLPCSRPLFHISRVSFPSVKTCKDIFGGEGGTDGERERETPVLLCKWDPSAVCPSSRIPLKAQRAEPKSCQPLSLDFCQGVYKNVIVSQLLVIMFPFSLALGNGHTHTHIYILKRVNIIFTPLWPSPGLFHTIIH